jgi:hypothetical protein
MLIGAGNAAVVASAAQARWGSDMTAVTATDVLGRTMLIIDRLSFPNLIGVYARLETGEEFYFDAPKVVKAQLLKNKFFPIWAKLVPIDGKNGTYYKLIFAQTVSWQRATEVATCATAL